MMQAIHIPQLLRAVEQTETIEVQDHLPDLDTLMPVQGTIRVMHKGNYLDVSAKAEAIVTLMCDRCLQQYNHRLSIDVSEMIWLQETAPTAAEDLFDQDLSSTEGLIESLPPRGYFEPDRWLYEQLCLEIPPRKLCDPKCAGIELSDELPVPTVNVDHRWASLEALKKQMLN
nr:YceD family protein [Thermoleptolyngbya sp. M55_K2018_002]